MGKQLQQTLKTKITSVKQAKNSPAAKLAEVVVPTPVFAAPQTGKNAYLNNRDLLEEVKKSKKRKQMTDKFAKMLQLLCARYAKKGNFINYTYNEDMQAYALLMLVRTWDSFDPAKSSNAFAFFTQCIKNSFIQYLNQEKRQRVIRDLLLVDQGLSPSFSFKDSDNQHAPDDEQNIESQNNVADLLSGKPKKPEMSDSPDESVDINKDSGDGSI